MTPEASWPLLEAVIDLLVHHDLLGDLLELLDDLPGLWESKGPASTERKGV
jgi:hypothetical protein